MSATLLRVPPQTLPASTVGAPVQCPDLDCGHPAEVVATWVWPSTDGPVPHARTRCQAGHVFTPPSGWLIAAGDVTREARS